MAGAAERRERSIRAVPHEASAGDAAISSVPRAANDAGPSDHDRFHAYLMDANRGICDQIRVADQKAAYIFTFVLALLVWSSETRKAFNAAHFANAGIPTLAITVLLLTSVVVTLLAAIFAIMPRTKPGTSVLYWGAWPNVGERVATARRAGDLSFIDADLLKNTETLACICRTKYRFVILAFRSLLVLVLCYLGLLFLPT